jgi:GTP-binding protein
MFEGLAFHTTVNDLRDLPSRVRVEVAFAGRSNTGKSSAINALARRRRLAFVSKTPGRTQHINYFALDEDCYLVDLPGYGYAKVPDATREHWRRLLSAYLHTRECLRGLVLIMDIRHPLTRLDSQMLGWFATTGKPVHILLTKSDKLTRQQATKTLQQVKAELDAGYPNATIQLFSSATGVGLEQAEQVIGEWLRNGAIKSPRLKGRKTGGQTP